MVSSSSSRRAAPSGPCSSARSSCCARREVTSWAACSTGAGWRSPGSFTGASSPHRPVTRPRPAAAELSAVLEDPVLDAPRPLDGLLALARALAGPDLLALILSGSHARGDAVWAEVEGRKILLSDLDVYAV